jgi:hypothetical protein
MTRTLTISVPVEIADDLDTALEYVEDRLIGRVPAAMLALLQAVSRADTRAWQIVGNDGQPLSLELGERDPEREAQMDAEIEAYEAWADSPEGKAELDEADRFAEWQSAQRARTEADYRAWLDSYVDEFDAARSAWRRSHLAQLRTEFAAQTTN